MMDKKNNICQTNLQKYFRFLNANISTFLLIWMWNSMYFGIRHWDLANRRHLKKIRKALKPVHFKSPKRRLVFCAFKKNRNPSAVICCVLWLVSWCLDETRYYNPSHLILNPNKCLFFDKTAWILQPCSDGNKVFISRRSGWVWFYAAEAHTRNGCSHIVPIWVIESGSSAWGIRIATRLPHRPFDTKKSKTWWVLRKLCWHSLSPRQLFLRPITKKD